MDDEEILHTGLSIEDGRRRYPARTDAESDSRPLISSTLFIQGEWLQPETCTEAVGMRPTSTSSSRVKKGTWLPSGKDHVTTPYWALEVRDLRSYEISDSLTALLDRLWPQRRALREFVRRDGIDAGFTTSVQIFGDRPDYSLGPAVLKRLSYFGVEWGLDLFDYSDET